MKELPVRSILVSQAELRRFLKKNFRGFETKDYELLIGLNLAMIGTEESGVEHLIAFPLKGGAHQNISEERNEENIENVLRSYIEENTSIDLILVPAISILEATNQEVGKATGRSYQLKRFAYAKEAGDISKGLVEYLTKDIPRKYPRMSKTDLVLVIGGGIGGGHFDMDFIKTNLEMEDYPFEHILFVTGDDKHLIVGEFWPFNKSKTYDFNL